MEKMYNDKTKEPEIMIVRNQKWDIQVKEHQVWTILMGVGGVEYFLDSVNVII